MIDTAITYGGFGLKVFPVIGKVPAITGWKESSSSDAEIIRRLFQIKHTGIGFATGAISNITVIDIDLKNGVNGFSSLEKLGIEFPNTVCALTPTGGRHYYFQYTNKLKSRVSVGFAQSGIDIRNDGSLIIMPPSVHPNGEKYEFLTDQGLGEIGIAQIPEEIIELLEDKKNNDSLIFELPPKINDGERNNILFKYACKLRASGLDKTEILPALYTVNTERCVPPYDKDKIEIIADSACKYPKGKKSLSTEQVVYSDTYNAKVFHEFMGERIKWCRDYGGWFIYNGKIWDKDNNDKIKRYALDTSEEIADRMRQIGASGKTNLRRIHTEAGLLAMISCAKPYFGCSADDFDKDKHLINCLNGTYDLNRNIFCDFNQDNLLTKMANVKYDINAEAPRWKQFLEEVFLEDKDLISYVQRVVGYGMTAFTKEHCMFILYGHGRNGKNIFTEAISGVLGDYALNCPSSMLIQKQNPGIPNDVARLKGARFVSASETNQNVNLDEELIKQLTGNKIITARFLNKEFFDFEATFKIFLATNHKPNIRGTDTGIWSRIQMIPFNMTITPDREDKDLAEKLNKEFSGIFNWMIEGYNDWRKQGLNVPEVVKRAVQLYREEEDDLGQFIKSECVIEKGGFIPSQEFRERFKIIMGYPKGTKTLGEYMAKHGFKTTDDNRLYFNGRQQRGFVGIRWAEEKDRVQNKGWLDE